MSKINVVHQKMFKKQAMFRGFIKDKNESLNWGSNGI